MRMLSSRNLVWFSLVASAAALSAVSPGNVPSKVGADAPKKLNFHQVLQRVGKSVFRPGGTEATNVLHKWADLKEGDTALEMSAGLGTGGITLAKRFQCNVILTDQDEDRLALAEKLAKRKGVANRIQVRKLDMRKLDETIDPTERFDAVLVEASLSHQPDVMKEKIVRDLRDKTDQLLIHEIGLRNCDSKQADVIKRQMGSTLAIGFYPLTLDKWKDLLDRNGYKVTHLEHGPIRVLNPVNMLQDEGPKGMAKIAWNLATHPELRDRVITTRSMVNSHKETLGFVILRAVKKE